MQDCGDNRVTVPVTVLSPAVPYNVTMLSSRFSTIAPAAATTVLALAGCGGSKPPPAAATGSQSKGPGVQAAYKFSACMRRHGVSNFPDPVVHSSGNSQSIRIKINPTISGSPAFNSAQKACQGLMGGPPNLAQQQAQIHYKVEHYVAFAACMRRHGITSFPDPNSQGNIPPTLLAQAGINIHLPNVITAARACAPTTGGLLTQAAISQATGSGSSASGSSGSGTQSNGGG
jgi:hypothetical protein